MTNRISPEHRKWWTLGAAAFGLFMIMLDNTVVNVALPSIRRDLARPRSGRGARGSGEGLMFEARLARMRHRRIRGRDNRHDPSNQ
jgi:hypothetical protein